jgi:2-polyprenyl-6-methoxyphenol hydroxylase-like FAD-dependent oxidoreductase
MLASTATQRGKSVLISGASIAGPALAYWLSRYGFRPVVVERSNGLRAGGQGVDLEGAAQNVTRLMGLEGKIRAAHTGELGWRFVDTTGQARAVFSAGTGTGPSKDLEILRGDLARLLYEHGKASTEYMFDNSIEALHDHGDRVTASFTNGPDRDFDVVVGADGVRSKTRRLFLGGEPGCSDAEVVKPLGLYMAYFTMPKGERDSAWAEWCTVLRSRVMFIRPDNVGSTRALLSFLSSTSQGYELQSPGEQKAALARTFGDAGWEAPRIVEGMIGSEDFYLDYIAQVSDNNQFGYCDRSCTCAQWLQRSGVAVYPNAKPGPVCLKSMQVRSPRWSKGLCAVVGDAAYCPTALTGMGTSLAVLGAYILAGELAKHSSTQEGLASYERVLRGYVDKAQRLAPGVPRLAYPKTALGVACVNTFLSAAASSLAMRARLFGGQQEQAASPSGTAMVTDQFGFQLPDYTAYQVGEDSR